MHENWKRIWEKRKLDPHLKLSIADLIAADGFDYGAGKISEENWRIYAKSLIDKLSIREKDSVYEVGCGSGALLYALREYLPIKIGGADYSQNLIDIASRYFDDAPNFIQSSSPDFKCLEANKIDETLKYDILLSNGVFHYFDLNYAEEVLLKMLKKANRFVYILDIPDIKTSAASQKMRADKLSTEEYEKKYAGLPHTYYDRDWFLSIAHRQNLRCEITNQSIPNYAQNEFRFCCLIYK